MAGSARSRKAQVWMGFREASRRTDRALHSLATPRDGSRSRIETLPRGPRATVGLLRSIWFRGGTSRRRRGEARTRKEGRCEHAAQEGDRDLWDRIGSHRGDHADQGELWL